MPVISKDLTEHGAVVDLLVGVSASRLEKLERMGFKPPARVRVRTLVDTGSHVTGFDPSVFAALEIGSVGDIALHTPSTGATPYVAERFRVNLSILHGAALESWHAEMFVISSAFFDSDDVKGLLGRDFLKGCLFVYDGERDSFSLAF